MKISTKTSQFIRYLTIFVASFIFIVSSIIYIYIISVSLNLLGAFLQFSPLLVLMITSFLAISLLDKNKNALVQNHIGNCSKRNNKALLFSIVCLSLAIISYLNSYKIYVLKEQSGLDKELLLKSMGARGTSYFLFNPSQLTMTFVWSALLFLSLAYKEKIKAWFLSRKYSKVVTVITLAIITFYYLTSFFIWFFAPPNGEGLNLIIWELPFLISAGLVAYFLYAVIIKNKAPNF